MRTLSSRATGERGIALLAVLFALTLLMLLALPFAISMSVGADAAMRDVEATATEQASASVRDLLLADAALSHPAIDPTPTYDGLDEFPSGVLVPEKFQGLYDEGRVLLGGEVVDLQRYLALDSASPLSFANVLGTVSRLTEDLQPDAGAMTLENATAMPESGVVWVQNELIRYGQREGNTLLELERGLFRSDGFADGSQPIPAESLVLDYRCVLASAWPFFGRADGSRTKRAPYRSVGELAEIQAAGLGAFTVEELDAFARVFAVDTRAETAGTWGRPERVFNELLPGETMALTVKSAVHVGAGSTVRLRDLKTGAVEYSLVMSSEQVNTMVDLQLPAMFTLSLMLPVAHAFPAIDTVVEPLLPAPVNVNTAPLEVLQVVLADVRQATRLQVTDPSGRRQAVPPYITRSMARDLAAELVALRGGDGSDGAGGGGNPGPFTGWQDLVTRFFAPHLANEGNNAERNRWLTLYRNLRTGRDAVVEMGTAPICFESGPWVEYRAAASRSRSVVAPGVAARHERSGLAAALPGFLVERRWATQDAFEDAFVLDRRAPYWITAPINLGHLIPGQLGNDPAPRFFPHLVPVAYPSLGLGAPRFPVADVADSGIEPATSVARCVAWGQGTTEVIAQDAFAQTNHRRGRQLPQDGPYQMNNTGPQGGGAGPAGAGAGGGGVRSFGGGRHDQLSFPFSNNYGFMGRFGVGFWLEPQRLDSVVVLDHGDGDPERNRLSVQGLDGNLVLEVIDEAGLDPNPSDSPAGVQRTASSVQVPLAELVLPADTAVHLNVSAPSGRPADLSLAVDGMVRGKPKYVTYLSAALPTFDPSLANNQGPPGQTGSDRYLDIQVESTEGFPPVGVLRIGLELFEYSGIQGNAFQCRWKDSLGGRGARMTGRENRPAIPVDANGEPTVDIDELQQSGVNLDVFPTHPAGSVVELYGYAAPLSEDTAMMVGATQLDGALGAFAVARGFIQNPTPIVISVPGLPPFTVGTGIDTGWTGDLQLADPVPSGSKYPPDDAQADIQNAFPTGGGYALIVQVRMRWEQSQATQSGSAEFGGVELIRYASRQGAKLQNVQRAQQLPGQDGQIDPNEYNGSARRFVTNFVDDPLPGDPSKIVDDVTTWIVFVVPVSLGVQSTNVLWNPQTTGLTEWVQLYTKGNPNDTEWVRYDVVADGKHLVRANRAAWDRLRFALTQATGRVNVTVSGSPPSASSVSQPPPTTPPWPNVQPTSGHIGYVPQLENSFTQIHAARRALRFRGDPFTGTSSHPQSNATVMQCQRLQLPWGNFGAYSGRVGRNDRVAIVQGSTASGAARPNVEWHTVNWQARRFNADNLTTQQTPPERLGPWAFQLVAFTDAVRGQYLGPPSGTVIDDPRRFDRVVKFPSGELPAAYCRTPTIGAGVNNQQPMTGIVDEVEVASHVAQDLVLDDVFASTAQQFTVNRAVTMLANGPFWYQQDQSAAFPQGGGLVQIDTEILAYQSRQDGIFVVATNGRGLLNTQPKDHDRGARVKFLTHRPAAILRSGIGAQEATIPVQDLGALPRAGTLLLGRELLHYSWVRAQSNSIEMPRWYPRDAGDGGRARGLLRGRFGTNPQGGAAGEPVIAFPFRYWDRYHEESDDPELGYFQMTTNVAPVLFRTLRWRQETQDARVEVLCRVRADDADGWAADPATTPGLWEFRGSSQEQTPHRLDRQASRLELRFQTVYGAGAIDLQSFRAHGWKTAARIEDVRVDYEGQGRVFDERVTAR